MIKKFLGVFFSVKAICESHKSFAKQGSYTQPQHRNSAELSSNVSASNSVPFTAYLNKCIHTSSITWILRVSWHFDPKG